MVAAPDDNVRDDADDATQILPAGDADWPVSDLYRIEQEGTSVDDMSAMDATVVARAPVPEQPIERRLPVDPVPGLLAAIVAVLLLVGLAAWLVSRGEDDDGDLATTTQELPTTAPTETSTTPTTTTPASERDVQDVVGMAVGEARSSLEEAGFRVRVVRRESTRRAGEVLEQAPKAGSVLAADEMVVLTVARVPAPDAEPSNVRAPDVVGVAVSSATRALREAGLQPRIELVTSDEPAGTVLAQSPQPGREVADGSVVELEVAKARQPAVERVEMPDIVGDNVADARAGLEDLGLRVRVVRVVAADPAGTVVGQSPEAGAAVRDGGTVTLRVSTGTAEVTVPDVVGFDEAAARLQLESAGFDVRVTDQSTTDPAEDGLVVEQTPRGGSTARERALVTIIVARVD